jgi:ribosomal protein L19E
MRLAKIAELQSKLKKHKGSGSYSGRGAAPRREPERWVEQPKANSPTQKVIPAKKSVIEVIQ